MTTAVGLSHLTMSTLVQWEAPLFVGAFVPSDFSQTQPAEQIKKPFADSPRYRARS